MVPFNMGKIYITKGLMTMVDDDIENLYGTLSWSVKPHGKTFYAKRTERGITVYLHRLILSATGHLEVDHIDGNGLNNRRSNLRLVTHRQNMQNQHGVTKTSKYPGVYWNSVVKKWQAYCHINNKTIYLGIYLSQEYAFAARNAYLQSLL